MFSNIFYIPKYFCGFIRMRTCEIQFKKC